MVTGYLSVFKKDNVSLLRVFVRLVPFPPAKQGGQVLTTPTIPEPVGQRLNLSPLLGEEVFVCEIPGWGRDSPFLS